MVLSHSFIRFVSIKCHGYLIKKKSLRLSITELLEEDIKNGELADFLDLSLSTITREFKICENKELIYTNIGQGTFVSPNAAIPSFKKGESDCIELSIIKLYYQFNTIVADTAKGLFSMIGPLSF